MWNSTKVCVARYGRRLPNFLSIQTSTIRVKTENRQRGAPSSVSASSGTVDDVNDGESLCSQWCTCHSPLYTPWWAAEVPANGAAIPLTWQRYRFPYDSSCRTYRDDLYDCNPGTTPGLSLPSALRHPYASQSHSKRVTGLSSAEKGVTSAVRQSTTSPRQRRRAIFRYSTQRCAGGRSRQTGWERAWVMTMDRRAPKTKAVTRSQHATRRRRYTGVHGRRRSGVTPQVLCPAPPSDDIPSPPPCLLSCSSGAAPGSTLSTTPQVFYYCQHCYGVCLKRPSYDRHALPYASSPYATHGLSLREKASTAASAVWDSFFGSSSDSGEPSTRIDQTNSNANRNSSSSHGADASSGLFPFTEGLSSTQERLSVFLQKLSPMLRLVGLKKPKSSSGAKRSSSSGSEAAQKASPLTQPPSTRHQVKAVLSFGKELAAQVQRSKITSASPLFMLSSMVKLTLGSGGSSHRSPRPPGHHAAPPRPSPGPARMGANIKNHTGVSRSSTEQDHLEHQRGAGSSGGRSRPVPKGSAPSASEPGNESDKNAVPFATTATNDSAKMSFASTFHLTVEQRYELYTVAVETVRYAIAVYGVAYEQGMLHSVRKSILLFTHPLYQPLNYVSAPDQRRAVERLVQATSSSTLSASSRGNQEQLNEESDGGVRVLVSHYSTGDVASPCSSYIIAVDHDKKQVVVSFRGTATLSDAVGCVRDGYAHVALCFTPEEDVKQVVDDKGDDGCGGGGAEFTTLNTSRKKDPPATPTTTTTRIPLGFYDMALSRAKPILGQLQRLAATHPGYDLILTGHSLGGILATTFHLLCCLPAPTRLLHMEELYAAEEPGKRGRSDSVVLPHWLDDFSNADSISSASDDVIPCCDSTTTTRDNNHHNNNNGGVNRRETQCKRAVKGFSSIQSISFAPAPTVEYGAAVCLSRWLQQQQQRSDCPRPLSGHGRSAASRAAPWHRMASFCYAQDLVPRLQSYAIRRFLLQHHDEEEAEPSTSRSSTNRHNSSYTTNGSSTRSTSNIPNNGNEEMWSFADSNSSFFSSIMNSTLSPLRRSAARSLAGPPPSGASHLYIPGLVFFLPQEGPCGGVQPAELEDPIRSDMRRITHPTPMSSMLDVLRHHVPLCYVSRVHSEYLFYKEQVERRKRKGAVAIVDL